MYESIVDLPSNIYNEVNLVSKIDLNNQKSILYENNIKNNKEYLDEYSQDFINKNYIDLSFLECEENINSNNNNSMNLYNNNRINIPENISENSQLYNTIIPNLTFNRFNQYNKLYYNNNNNNNLYIINLNKIRKNQNNSKKNINKKYIINIMDIKANKEKRTTIRMMNIPSYFTPLDLMKKIDEKFGISPQKENRIYNFIYIPLRDNNKNAGYAFINFVHPQHVIKFYFLFNGKHLKSKASKKMCSITFAEKQGAYIKNKEFKNDINGNYLFFSDTKNHKQFLDEKK